MLEQNLPCPVCQSKIPFDSVALIQGYKFSCHNCNATVGISNDDLEHTSKIYDKYNSLKQNLQKVK